MIDIETDKCYFICKLNVYIDANPSDVRTLFIFYNDL